jgi:N utilization substance protein A
MRAKFDVELLGLMKLFEDLTRARVKDCFYNREKLVFVVEPGELMKALGRDRGNVQRLEERLKRQIKIIEYSEDMLTFIRNMMHPLRMLDISYDGEGVVTIKGTDTKTKGLMIGARAQNLRNYEEIARKYFDELKEIRVV